MVGGLLTLSALAQTPANVPRKSFSIKLPEHWVCAAPDQWTSQDGRISLVMTEVPNVRCDLASWLARSQRTFPGNLNGEPQKITLDGEPGYLLLGQHHGRVQRACFSLHQGTGVILVFSCRPTQSFAAASTMTQILQGFRWRP